MRRSFVVLEQLPPFLLYFAVRHFGANVDPRGSALEGGVALYSDRQ